MGFGLPSHIDQGVLFGSLGLWHLSNTLVSFAKSPNAFHRRTWFPVPIPWLPASLRCLELWILLLAVLAFLSTQISHITDDLRRGHIQAQHLQRFQHITFGMFFLTYTVTGLASAISGRLPLPDGALHGIFALGFLMELLVFHLGHHPGDSLESFVHMLMQIVLAALVMAMVLEIALPYSFLASTVRCMLLALKGSWFFHIGLLLNCPTFVPLGCGDHPGGEFPLCSSAELPRAKSIQVLAFGWHALGVLVVTIVGYASLVGFHGGALAMERYQRIASRPGRLVLNTIEELELEIKGEEIVTPGLRSLSRRRSYKGTDFQSARNNRDIRDWQARNKKKKRKKKTYSDSKLGTDAADSSILCSTPFQNGRTVDEELNGAFFLVSMIFRETCSLGPSRSPFLAATSSTACLALGRSSTPSQNFPMSPTISSFATLLCESARSDSSSQSDPSFDPL